MTEQLNLRLEDELLTELANIAKAEALDRAVVVRRILQQGVARWKTDNALSEYQAGAITLGRAAEDAGMRLREMMDLARDRGISQPYEAGLVQQQLGTIDILARSSRPLMAVSEPRAEYRTSLPDIAPRPGGALLVGINPAPASVAAGHYYQGKLGRRLWKRLAAAGLLEAPVPGREDEAFREAGHGLTDLVKRPTRAAGELNRAELEDGVESLAGKVRQWRPGLIVLPFKQVAKIIFPGVELRPGLGPEFAGAPMFLLSGPYAPKADAEAVDRALAQAVARLPASDGVEETDAD
ncbi:MAG: uracil-DNA glycosylase family protein [Dehalococcoidia bacterium]